MIPAAFRTERRLTFSLGMPVVYPGARSLVRIRLISSITMKSAALLLAFTAAVLSAQAVRKPVVEFEMMTWPEIKRAIQDQGMINVILYNGGVEQRGPQNVSGGHNLMAAETARAIALKLRHTL